MLKQLNFPEIPAVYQQWQFSKQNMHYWNTSKALQSVQYTPTVRKKSIAYLFWGVSFWRLRQILKLEAHMINMISAVSAKYEFALLGIESQSRNTISSSTSCLAQSTQCKVYQDDVNTAWRIDYRIRWLVINEIAWHCVNKDSASKY